MKESQALKTREKKWNLLSNKMINPKNSGTKHPGYIDNYENTKYGKNTNRSIRNSGQKYKEYFKKIIVVNYLT